MDVLPSGDLVITGRCYGTGTFGTHSITVSGNFYDAYVARLSSAGQWQWVAQAGGSHWDKGFGVCADAAGDVYVAGTFRNTATFGSTALTATGSNNDGWLAKLDGNGQWLWAVQMGSIAYMEVYAMDMNDAGDRLVLTGNYAFNTPTIGGLPLPTPVLNDAYVMEYSTTGQVLSVLGVGGAGGDRGMAAVYGPAGALFVAGSFGADMLVGADQLTCVSTPDLWVGRLDPDLSTGVGFLVASSEFVVRPVEAGVVLRNPAGLRGHLSITDALGRVVFQGIVSGATDQRFALPQGRTGTLVWHMLPTEGTARSGKLIVELH